jgi:hypothetical protein
MIDNMFMNLIVGGKKKAVVFNEESRVEYLTGFRHRKLERRKHGLTLKVQFIFI